MTRGLTIENATQGDIRVPNVKVTDDPATIGEVDLVVIAVKLWDTDAAARAVKPMVGAHTAVLSLQNGVPSPGTFRRLFERLDPDAFTRCFTAWVTTLRQHTQGEVVSIDGKTLRHSFGHPPHLV